MNLKNRNSAIRILLYFLISSSVYARTTMTYHGRLTDPNGNVVTASNVNFLVQIRSPGTENCILYEEVQTLDLSSTKGGFSFVVNSGSGTRRDSSGIAVEDIFSNNRNFTFGAGQCASGTTFTPSTDDSRNLYVYFNDGTFPASEWEALPATTISAVPKAINSDRIGGYPATQLIRVANGVSQTQTELSSGDWTKLLDLISGTSTQYASSASSMSVGGTVTSLPYGTATGQTGQFVMRELAANGTNSYTIKVPDSLTADRTLVLPDSNGTTGQVLSTNGSGVTSWVTALTSTNGFINGGNSFGAASTIGNNDAFDLSFETNGVTRMTLGNTANTYNMSVVSNKNTGVVADFDDNSSGRTSGAILQIDSDSADNTGYNLFSVNNQNMTSSKFIVRGDGRVGVGTTTPADLMQIYSSNAKYGLIVGNVAVPAVASGPFVRTEGRIYSGDGSAALPSFSFGLAGQEDNGMFRAANDTIGFSTSGTEKLRIDSTGNLGIGVSSPTNILSINGDSSRTVAVVEPSPLGCPVGGCSGSGLTIGAGRASTSGTNKNGGDLTLTAGTSTGTGTSSILFQTSSSGSAGTTDNAVSTKMVLDGSGRVGIGVASPSAKLDITDTASVATGTGEYGLKVQKNWAIADSNTKFAGNFLSNSYNSGTLASSVGVGSEVSHSNGSLTAAFGFYNYGTMAAGSSVFNRYGVYLDDYQGTGTVANQYGVYINSYSKATKNYGIYVAGTTPSYFGGNVGILTNAASAPLHINSTVDTTSNGVTAAFKIGDTTSGFLAFDHDSLQSFNGASTSGLFINYFGGDINFGNGKMNFDNTNGRLGIGTMSPQTALQVAGIISPATNNNFSLGNSSYRFTEVYATNGTINTSDRREKKDITDSNLGLEFIKSLRPVSYRWNTGVDNDIHYGFIAQEVELALKSNTDLENKNTSIVTYDEKSDRYGVRYSELIGPIVRAIKELYIRFVDVEQSVEKQSREIASKADQSDFEGLKSQTKNLTEENEKLKSENALIKSYLCQKDPSAPFCK